MSEFRIEVPISKLDDEQRLAFGWASIAVEADGTPVIDHQGDVIPVAELEKAAHDYLVTSRDASDMHERNGVGTLVESIVVTPEKREAMGLEKSGPTGWFVGYRVHDDSVWKRIKSGELAEFSIEGSAVREDAQ